MQKEEIRKKQMNSYRQKRKEIRKKYKKRFLRKYEAVGTIMKIKKSEHYGEKELHLHFKTRDGVHVIFKNLEYGSGLCDNGNYIIYANGIKVTISNDEEIKIIFTDVFKEWQHDYNCICTGSIMEPVYVIKDIV